MLGSKRAERCGYQLTKAKGSTAGSGAPVVGDRQRGRDVGLDVSE
jgi:hypothetical protein